MSLPLVAIERASGSVSEICLSSLFIISALIALSRATSSFSFAMSFADAIAMIAAAEELPEDKRRHCSISWALPAPSRCQHSCHGQSSCRGTDERALSDTSEDALASSLEKLVDGERGWIPLVEAASSSRRKIGNTRSVNLTMPAKSGSRRSQLTIGARRTSGRPKVACTSARTANLKRDTPMLGLSL